VSEHEEPAPGYAEAPSRADVLPWALMLGPALLYLLVLAIRYALVHGACDGPGARVALEVAGFLGVLVTASPAALAWRSLRRDGLGAHASARGESGRHILLQMAVLSGTLFGLLALATWIPSWVVSPCHP
jgi:hypothetical protein